MLLQIDGTGKVLRFLEDYFGEVLAGTSAVTEGPDGLYVGTFSGDYMGFVAYSDLPDV